MNNVIKKKCPYCGHLRGKVKERKIKLIKMKMCKECKDKLDRRNFVAKERPPAPFKKQCSNCLFKIGGKWCPTDRKERAKKENNNKPFYTEGPCNNWLFAGLEPIISHKEEMLEKLESKFKGDKDKADYQCNRCKSYVTKKQIKHKQTGRDDRRTFECPYCHTSIFIKLRPIIEEDKLESIETK